MMHLIKNVIWASLVAALVGVGEAAALDDLDSPPLGIRLYNPTDWDGPLPIEVPVGRLAAPGLVDWSDVRLVTEAGVELPFGICEGRPHWKSRLETPIGSPRAEDLLVFSCAVKPHTWMRIEIRPGGKSTQSAVTNNAGKLVVSYPNMRATLDPSTGMLVQWEVFGQPVLDAPMHVDFSTGVLDFSCLENTLAILAPPKLSFTKSTEAPLGPPRVRLVSQSSNAAMTEIHFVIETTDGPSLAVSYRIHACGVVDIRSDERPWQGPSPWVDHAASIAFPIGGQTEGLPFLLNRAPFYGFKDFIAVVHYAAALHRYPKATVLELGEDTPNGRRWRRSLYPISAELAAQANNLVTLVDQGVILEASPKTARLPAGEIRIAYSKDDHVPAKVLVDALKTKGVAAVGIEAGPNASDAIIALSLVEPQKAADIQGDGFRIESTPDGNRFRLIACTRLGLMQASQCIANHWKRCDGAGSIPLVASNPVVGLRAGGFGGGNFEVDFPYGSEVEWREALDPMIASGMNVMTALGMWGNWKMPISYRDMPELRSNAPDAYDEVSGAKLSEIDMHREHGLRLLKYLHDRGVKVWLWLPVGCVPTTYTKAHPDAMCPKNDRYPCFTHPLYARYLETFLTELLATYPIDGFMMVRDDNGGLCSCDRCKAHVAASPTQSASWEQYLILYRWLKGAGFQGDIAVYPYYDIYQPRLDRLLPSDLQIVGHGSAAAVLARNYESQALMGDTWLDNPFASFRVPTAARMRRLLADRGSYWVGGAFCGCELPWMSIGRFGWEPTATVNTLRYEQGISQFGRDRALAFVELADSYERLWELFDLPMLPQEWVKLSDAERSHVVAEGHKSLEQFRNRLAAFRKSAGAGDHEAWFRHVGLFGAYFDYHLQRLERFSRMQAIAMAHKDALTKPEGLAPELREQMIAMHREIYELSERYDRQAADVPGKMMEAVRANHMTQPFKEWVGNYDASLEYSLEIRQFAGTMEVVSAEFKAGEPFVLRVQLQNTGVCPWIPGVGHRLEISGDVERLGLPKQWEYEGPSTVYGDRRVVELRGVAPKEPGETQCHVTFLGPFRNRHEIMQRDITVRWK